MGLCSSLSMYTIPQCVASLWIAAPNFPTLFNPMKGFGRSLPLLCDTSLNSFTRKVCAVLSVMLYWMNQNFSGLVNIDWIFICFVTPVVGCVCFVGGAGGDRTHDQGIMSATLLPLSYSPMFLLPG